MAGKGALPLLLLAGGAALLMMGGKKSGGGSATGDIYSDDPALTGIEPSLKPTQSATEKASFDPLILLHQMHLKLLGYYKGNLDGINGASTKSAVREFQMAVKRGTTFGTVFLLDPNFQVDGRIGPATQEKILAAMVGKGVAAKAESIAERYRNASWWHQHAGKF